MKYKKKNKILLFSLLLLISLGYALLSANLRINGSSKIASSTWNIHFNNIVPKQGSVPIKSGDQAATITPNKDTEVTYSVTLSKPGDFYEFNVDVVNSGSIDGMVELINSVFKEEGEEDIIINEDSSNIPSYLNYSITYSDGAPIKPTYLLKAGETDTYTVRIEFKKDISNNELPEDDQTFNIVIDGDYKQADKTAKEKPPYNPCTYDGELVQGAEYVNGQYTYRYMQEFGGTSWANMVGDGWGVTLTDKDSTNPVTSQLCTSINNKPIISMQAMYYKSKASSIDTSSINSSNVINMQQMFAQTNVNSLDVSLLDTSNVTKMTNMFGNIKVTSIDVSNFDTASVTNMDSMFMGCNNLVNIDLSNFDMRNITSAQAMLYGTSSLNSVNLDNWDISNLSSSNQLTAMFYSSGIKRLSARNWKLPASMRDFSYTISLGGNNGKIELIDVSGWEFSTATNAEGLFAFCNSLIEIKGLGTWDTSNITSMKQMFHNDSKIKKINLKNWNTSNVVDMSSMFSNCSELESVNVSGFDTRNVIDMTNMFIRTSSLNELDLSSFNMSNVTTYNAMFYDSGLTKVYVRTQADADKMIQGGGLPNNITFEVK